MVKCKAEGDRSRDTVDGHDVNFTVLDNRKDKNLLRWFNY
jgi:hypothetical protein